MLKSNFLSKNEKNNKTILQKEFNFFYTLFEYMYRSWLFHSYFTYQMNSQSMGLPDKRKTDRDSRFIR